MATIPREMVCSEYESEMLGLLTAGLSEAFDGVAKISQTVGPVRANDSPTAPDALLTLQAKGESTLLAVEILRNAYPRDIRRAIWILDEFKSPQRSDCIKMVAAESLSPGAKTVLKDRGIAYFEKGGSLYLRSKRWFINIDRPSKAPSRSATTSLFTDAREGVVHSLLMNSHRWMTGNELAELAQTSAYTCSVVLQELVSREWCESVGGGRTLRRRLVRPAKLLDAWAEHWVQRRESKTRGYFFVENPKNLLQEVCGAIKAKGLALGCVVTGVAAANALAPLLTEVDTVDLVVPPGSAKDFLQALRLKPATKGANVSLVEREPSTLLFNQPFDSFSCNFASPYILYLDLLDGRGRNKELAEHIREKLESKWSM